MGKNQTELWYVYEHRRKFIAWAMLVFSLTAVSAIVLGMEPGFAICILALVIFFDHKLIREEFLLDRIIEQYKRELVQERKQFEKFMDDYRRLKECKFMQILPELREAACYLLSMEGMTPDQVREKHRDELVEKERFLLYLEKVQERTFWQYLMSGKWLKKIRSLGHLNALGLPGVFLYQK